MQRFTTLLAGLMTAPALLAADAATPAAPNLAALAAADYERQARYPAWTQPLRDAVDPLLAERTPSVVSQRGPAGQAPALAVWASEIAAQPGDTVRLFARVDWLDTERAMWDRLSRAGQDWTVTAELVTESGRSLGTADYSDRGLLAGGLAGDDRAGDGVYTAAFTLPANRAPALGTAESVLVKVTAVRDDGMVRKAAGGVLYSNPAARLTGVVKPTIADGHLVMLAQTEVLAPGRVHLAGTLTDALGVPRISAQSAEVLAPGTHWLALRFHGVAFHDLGVSGLVNLGSLSLRSTNGMPNALGPVLRDVTVATVPLIRLTTQPFGDAVLRETARRLRASLR